jgi:hypothetical protein
MPLSVTDTRNQVAAGEFPQNKQQDNLACLFPKDPTILRLWHL